MAIIIQLMIPAELSGILFTVDPSAADKTIFALQVTSGVGDGLAAGTETGIHLTFCRDTFKLTKTIPPAEEADLTVIEQTDWNRLLGLALQIEKIMRTPQDIEWAFANGRFWILQSRPITAIAKEECRQIWTRANAGEILPGVVTPLTWSIFKPTLSAAGSYRGMSLLTLHWTWRHPSGSWPDSPRLISGRAYMELASVYAGFCSLPGVDKDILQRLLGFEFNACRDNELPERNPRWQIMDLVRGALYRLEISGFTKTLSKNVDKWKSSGKPGRETHAGDKSSGDPGRILIQIDKLLKDAAKTLGLHIQCTSMAFSAFGLIHNIIRRNIGLQEAREFDIRMTGDFHDMTTAEQVIAIWDLAQAASNNQRVQEALFTNKSPEAIISQWRTSPDSNSFLALWDAFVEKFGDRGTEEFELAAAHWDENPSMVFRMMRESIRHRLPDPRESLSRKQAESVRSAQSMLELIREKSSPFETFFFRRLISVYQKMVRNRENMKYAVVVRFNALRKLFVALGDILHLRGLLESREDIFFLTHQEISTLARTAPLPSSDTFALVTERKTRHEGYLKIAPYDLWISSNGREMPLNISSSPNGSRILRGIGCSSGQITGKACIITSVPKNVTFDQNSIIVAPSIDPGLTPLFLSSIGVVTEIGGILSHGATVAREYGIPAVVGVPHATQVIQEGQQITVDGSAGLVYLGPFAG